MKPGGTIVITPDNREVHAMARELVRLTLPARTGDLALSNEEYTLLVARLAVALTLAVTDEWISETSKRGAIHEIPRK